MWFLGQLFVGFLVVVAVLALIGFFRRRRDIRMCLASPDEESLSRKAVDNVNALNDRFNRARYMDEDGN